MSICEGNARRDRFCVLPFGLAPGIRGVMPPNFPSPGELLPHRPPMLLICAVRAHTPGETVCDAVFDAAFARACGGEVPAAFGLELIAQAAAVHHALAQLAAGGVHVRAARGLLLGSRRLDLRVRALPVGEVLVVTVVGGGEQPGPGGLIRFEGRVENAAGTILTRGDATVLEMRPGEAPAVA